MKQGAIQIYTGDGKGKTTAALGLMFRAHGAGLSTGMFQFIKRAACAEHEAARELGIDIIYAPPTTTCPTGLRNEGKPLPDGEQERRDEEEIAVTRELFERACAAVYSCAYDLIVFDEIMEAIRRGSIREDELLDLLERKPPEVELILTGRSASQALMDEADLVTEMRSIKHYFDSGITAREGIEY